MLKRSFVLLLLLNAVLLGVCIGYYVALPEWRSSIVMSFDQSRPFVETPVGFRYAQFAFIVLNLPATLVVWGLMALVDRLFDLTPVVRAILILVSAALLSTVWISTLSRYADSVRLGRRNVPGG